MNQGLDLAGEGLLNKLATSGKGIPMERLFWLNTTLRDLDPFSFEDHINVWDWKMGSN